MSCNEDLNKNLLQGSKFKLNFDRLPDVSFFCTEAVIPGMSLSENPRTTPFVDYTIAGDKITYSPLEITFLINETLSPWREVHDWIRGLGFPTNFDEYKNLPNLQKAVIRSALQSEVGNPQYSDGTLSVYTNKNNLAFSISFKELYPIEISSISLATKMTAEDVITGTAKFAFMYYDVKI
jgi:hypothetical protein